MSLSPGKKKAGALTAHCSGADSTGFVLKDQHLMTYDQFYGSYPIYET